eukprot:s5848_g3.t1
MASLLALPEKLRLPKPLRGCWQRSYIRQTFREPRAIDTTGRVWYLQAPDGVCVDARIDDSGAGGHECFLGFAVWDEAEKIVSWHTAATFEAGCAEPNLEEALQKCAARAVASPAATEDRGRVTWKEEPNAWIETDPDGGSAVLEELWLRREGSKASCDEAGSGCRIRPAADGGSELLLTCEEHFAHVLCPRDGTMKFTMGSTKDWRVELSTSPDLQGSVLLPWH